MADMINWLNTNSGAVQGIAIVVLVLVTAFYGFQTWRQAKAGDKMAKATKTLAEEAQKRQSLADAYITVYVRAVTDGSIDPSIASGATLGVRVLCSNDGPGCAYHVEPLLINDRTVGAVEADWAKGDYWGGPGKHSGPTWALLPVGQLNYYDWGLTRAPGAEYVAVALWKDRLRRPWASAYGFRIETSGLVSTEVIAPHIQRESPGE